MDRRFRLLHIIPLLLIFTLAVYPEEEWTMSVIELPAEIKHPIIACSPEEQARLRKAFKGKGPGQDAVAAIVRKADRGLKAGIKIPPRGGQHNQWYQCEPCQMGLKKLSDTKHTCPKCEKVYSGPPYDDVIFSKKHYANLDHAHAAGWAWIITGRKKYAEYAAQMLLGYADKYLTYEFHDNRCRTGKKASRAGGRLFEQTLGEASRMAEYIAPAYDLIHDSGVLTEEQHKHIREDLIVPMLEGMNRHKAKISNWQTWHNAGMLMGGAVIHDVKWVRRAISQPGNGFVFQMKASVTADGMWYENSWGYHFYTLRAMTLIAEGARRLGIDLWTHPSLQKMYTIPGRYVMAGSMLPRFGDDVNSSAKGGYLKSMLEPAYNGFKDEAVLALLPGKASWESIMYGRDLALKPGRAVLGSLLFPAAGHAVLRSGGPAKLSAAFTFGPYGGFHGHFDKLSFVFFGNGKELGVDPGRAASQAYRLPIHKNWYKASISHNTVLVDRKSQEPAEGRLIAFGTGEGWTAASAACDEAYRGVQHTRTLVMGPEYLLVFDDLAAKAAHRFDWIYHNRGRGVICKPALKAGEAPADFTGFEYIKEIKTGRSDQSIKAEFQLDNQILHLTANARRGTGLVTGTGVGASVMDRVPLLMLTRSGKAAQFACSLEPVKRGNTPAVTDIKAVRKGRASVIVVERGKEQDTVIIQDKSILVRRGKKEVLNIK